jgi:cyclase
MPVNIQLAVDLSPVTRVGAATRSTVSSPNHLLIVTSFDVSTCVLRGSCTEMSVLAGVGYTRGLYELGRGTFAYLRPPGTWGWSDCGLVVADRQALLIDTQFDLPMTRDLLAAIDREGSLVVITTVVTHANGDHCWGDQFLNGVEIIGSGRRRMAWLRRVQPKQLAALSDPSGLNTPLGDYM